MDKKNKNPNVPNLRFTNNQLKDFKIVDICKLKQGNQYDLKQQFTEEKSDLKRFIRIIDYTQKTNDIRYVYSNGSENYVDCTDVVVVRYGASAGYVGRGINGIIANNLFTIRPINSALLNKSYLYHYLNAPVIQKQLNNTQSSGMPALNFQTINNLHILLPEYQEQRQIAVFLDKIDERIQTQIKIINDYKILKNHIIKSFIKQNGTSYLLSEIAELGRGRVINSAEISKQKNPIYPVYSSQTSNNGIMGYLDNYDYEGEYITWTTDGANAGTVYYRNGKFNCTNVCGILKIKNGYDAYYISNILNCYTKKYVSTNLANPKLMNNVMANIKINLPSIEQQKHSSKILQSIEYRVEIEEDIKLNLVKQKAFLLKNMFI